MYINFSSPEKYTQAKKKIVEVDYRTCFLDGSL